MAPWGWLVVPHNMCRSALLSCAGVIDRDQVIGVGFSPVNSEGFATRTLRPESRLSNRDGHAPFRREADRIYSLWSRYLPDRSYAILPVKLSCRRPSGMPSK